MKLMIEGIVVLLVVAFCLGLVKGYLDLPTVYYSHSKQQVVAVQYADGSRVTNPSPREIPEKYQRIQVK